MIQQCVLAQTFLRSPLNIIAARKAEERHFKPTKARLPLLMMPQTSMCTFKDNLCRPSIVQLCKAQRGEAQRLTKQGFLHIFYHKQKCLLARAFLSSPSIVQLRKAQRSSAQRLAEQGFLHILYHTFRKKERGNICFPKKVANRHAVKFVSPLRAFLRKCTSLSLPSRQFPFKLLPATRFVLTECARVRSFSMLRRIGLRSLVDRASQPSFAVHLVFRTDAPSFFLSEQAHLCFSSLRAGTPSVFLSPGRCSFG